MPKGYDKLGGEVIFLAHRNPNIVESGDTVMLSCKHCQNKTYSLSYDSHSGFPMLKCAACGQHHGRMGWAHDDEEQSR